MKYKDELRIAGVTALFCCAMLMITAVVPKDTTVAKHERLSKKLRRLLLMLKHRLRAKPKMLASLSIQKTAIMTMKITVTMIPALMIPVQILLTLILQAILLTILLMTTAQLIIQRIM